MRGRKVVSPNEIHCKLCGQDQPQFTCHCWFCHAALTDGRGHYLAECIKPVELEVTGCDYCAMSDCTGCYPS
jgi:hypothetical protein